jgi:DNA-binding HxlR family transcriptional regulator
MKGYGQFCPVAKAAEIVAERWTPLVLRELFCGSRRFGDLARGVPLMSPSLLTRRLRELEQAGIVSRAHGAQGRSEYQLTAAGRELAPVVEQLGVWGKRWTRAYIEDNDLDAGLLLWDVRRNILLERVPQRRIVVAFEFSGTASGKRRWWLVIEQGEVDLCPLNPGFEADLHVRTALRTLTEIWLGDRALGEAIEEGALELQGQKSLVRDFPKWLHFGPLSRVQRVAVAS